MIDRSSHLKPTLDHSTPSKTPSGIKGLEEKKSWNRLADELGRASWLDGARLQPRSRYSYM